MPKNIKRTAAAALAAILAAILPAGCDTLTGPAGKDGTNGKSAYEIALTNGFKGTEAEWLASLKGADPKTAYEFAVEQGFAGTVDQWIASLKGTNGRSAYETAVANGFVGTEAEWAASLKGANGKSAYQFAVEQGFVGTEAQWIASLQGKDGKPAPVMHPLKLGTFPVTLEDQTGQLTSERADWFQDSLTWLSTATNPYDSVVGNLTNGLKGNSNVRIIIEEASADAAEYAGKNYRSINGRTCAVRAEFVLDADTTYAQIRSATVKGLEGSSQMPVALFKANDTLHMPRAPFNTRTFAQQAAAQLPQGNRPQRAMPDRSMGRQYV
jgi:predicted small secreted protein